MEGLSPLILSHRSLLWLQHMICPAETATELVGIGFHDANTTEMSLEMTSPRGPCHQDYNAVRAISCQSKFCDVSVILRRPPVLIPDLALKCTDT